MARPTPTLPPGDDVLAVGLNRAVTLIEEKKAQVRAGAALAAIPAAPWAIIPQKGGPVVVRNGRYGPYVSHDGVNATLPGDVTPEAMTLDQAIGFIEARAARAPAETRDGQVTPQRGAQSCRQIEGRRGPPGSDQP